MSYVKTAFALAAFAATSMLAPAEHGRIQSPQTPSSPISVTAQDDIKQLDTVVVTGSAPGPGMWHVYSGDKDMWIFGTLSPLPANITWNSRPLRELLGQAQEVIWEPYYSVNVKSGLFQKMLLGYGMVRAGKNPEGKSLKDVLPPDLYARWSRAKARYLPRNRGVEFKRPMLAADDLFKAAVAAHGLSTIPIWTRPVKEAIAATGLKSTAPAVTVDLDAAAAKKILRAARKISFNDSACMAATLDAIERDLPRMITNANAWAQGDMQRINFAVIERREKACADVFSNLELARQHGLPDIHRSIRTRWMEEAEAALKRNQTTIAIVPMQHMLGPNGYAAQLKAKGYEVVEP